MTANEIRRKFIAFFVEKGHSQIPSASLVPEHDPTVLFTTAGMHPLIPYLMGEKHPQGRRLVNSQKCVRTQDILEVGDATHDTFFEMLGNWSLGDYFKKEAIEWSYEFLTSPTWLGIDPQKIVVTVFEGDADAPRDIKAAEIWKAVGIPEDRIFYKSKEHNWWGPAGASGPCGPDTEMFVYHGSGEPPSPVDPTTKESGYVEVWNDVFMEYAKRADGIFEPLKQKNVDTGMGLERIAMILQGAESIFETDLFLPIMRGLRELSSVSGADRERDIAERIVADHIRTAVLLITDGVLPSNTDQGYILRRLLRRAIHFARKLGIAPERLSDLVPAVVSIYADVYPAVRSAESKAVALLEEEGRKFGKTIERGMKEFQDIIARNVDERLSGKEAFLLFATYGFPLEMTKELAAEQKRDVDEPEFWKEFETHQNLSRKGAEQKFHGGLADHSVESTMLHTATHLVHQALKDVLGPDVNQRGSNITRDRLRFDFNYDAKMAPEQIARVEDIVNAQIQRDLPVHWKEMNVSDAKKVGAIGLFHERYSDRVKVYFVGEYSKEVCGGPHVPRTGLLKSFTITKEEAVGAGLRRLKAVVGGLQDAPKMLDFIPASEITKVALD